MKTETFNGPYSLRKRLHDATHAVSVLISKMTFEERREHGRKAFLRFTDSNRFKDLEE